MQIPHAAPAAADPQVVFSCCGYRWICYETQVMDADNPWIQTVHMYTSPVKYVGHNYMHALTADADNSQMPISNICTPLQTRAAMARVKLQRTHVTE